MRIFIILRTFVLLAGLAVFLMNCAPTAVYRLRPVSGEVAQIDGRTITKATSPDNLVIVASYEREDLQYIALDIEIKNQTSQVVDIDPSRFSTLALDLNQNPLPDPNAVGALYQRAAADPDQEVKRVVTGRIDEEKRLKQAKIMNTVLMVAVLAGSVAASSKPQSYEKYVSNRLTYNGAYTLVQAKRVIDHSTFANRMQRLDYEDYRWHELAMKRTTLQPGESVRGFVYLPKTPKAAYLQLQYPTADGTSLAVLFEQTTKRTR